MAPVRFSHTPSTMIFTALIESPPRLSAAAAPPASATNLRRSTMPASCESKSSARSHHSAPVTRAVSAPRLCRFVYAEKVSGPPSMAPTPASCQPAMPSEW